MAERAQVARAEPAMAAQLFGTFAGHVVTTSPTLH
jgi:hypothetical protein